MLFRSTFANPVFKFFEQLSTEDASNWATDTTYQTAIANVGTPVLVQGKVKIPFSMNRKGKGYTAKPNFEFTVYLNTPPAAGAYDSAYTFTQANVNLNLLAGGMITVDTLVLPEVFKAVNQVYDWEDPVISTAKYNTSWMTHGSYTAVTATASNTYKVDLLNGLKIADGGLGYTTAPTVRIENYASKQGTTNPYTLQTVATAATTIDAQGRIISIAAPVMADNLVIEPNANVFKYNMYTSYPGYITVPADVTGKVQAYARAFVNMYGTITGVVLHNEDIGDYPWLSTSYGGSHVSGKGYISTPMVKVTPVGKTSVDKNAVLKAVVNTAGRISGIIVVDGGKGYDVKNYMFYPDYLIRWIYTNGDSDAKYDIDMGSGYRGDIIDVWND